MDTRNRQILKIAIPSIVSNITVPLLGIVDVSIVGHLGSAAYIGAIAVGGMMFNVIYWVFGFLRMGTSGMTSQALGRRDLGESVSMLLRSICVALGVALLLILLQEPIRLAALAIMKPSPDVAFLATSYFRILIYGAPAMLGLFSLSGWFIGMQNSRIPMAIAIIQNIVNVVASLLLVLGCGMKVEGVALGTLIAQYGGFGMGLMLCLTSYGRLRPYARLSGLWDRDVMKKFFAVNRDIFLRTLCLVAVMLFFTSAGSWQGDVTLAVNTLLIQFYMIFSYIMDGFAYAGEAISGKYYGARNAAALRSTVRLLFVWGFSMVMHSPWRMPYSAMPLCRCSPTMHPSCRLHGCILIGFWLYRWQEWQPLSGTECSSVVPLHAECSFQWLLLQPYSSLYIMPHVPLWETTDCGLPLCLICLHVGQCKL